MPENESEAITSKDRINILLKEYDTLRAEILNRINQRWQMLGLVGAIITFVSTQSGVFTSRLILAYAVTVGLAILWVKSGQYVARLATHVAEIEKRVNSLAGEILLEWETQGRDRFIRRFFR